MESRQIGASASLTERIDLVKEKQQFGEESSEERYTLSKRGASNITPLYRAT